MLCEFKPVERWYCMIGIGMLALLLSLVAPAQARVVDSSDDKPQSSGAMPTQPTQLLNRLLSTTKPLSWRDSAGADLTKADSQIIWPPIDQPLDLRGGYKRAPQAASRPVIQSTNSGRTDSGPVLTRDDCESAAAFILAGARARDRGVSADLFMAQLRADLLKLGAEPPATRWFLHSQIEAQLLLSAAARIYHEPRAATWHFTNFVKLCDAHRASR